ncbi:MAG: aconitate hydratase [Desulfohalobiaceae bacterium]
MPQNLTQKIISGHLASGEMLPGSEIGLNMDQTLTQDATGTMAYLQLQAMGVQLVRTRLSVSYVDHNTLQMGFRNPDDHRFLRTAAARHGVVFSPPGTGICHQLHLENFAAPGQTLLGSDSHTPTAGGLGCLAIGAGGLSVALAMAGEPYTLPMPRVIQVSLKGSLQGWASAKDVILHLLGQLSVKGAVGCVLEYTGSGVQELNVPQRATIANMGAELGATSSIFPSDQQTLAFLRSMQREQDFQALEADEGARYEQSLELDLGSIQPMAACPHMPDKAVEVRELAGRKANQVVIGSCTNSSYADLKTAALILRGKRVHPETDTIIAPGSRQVLKLLSSEGLLEELIDSGARILECACGPCIGMGGSPVSQGVSLRTFNRNFEGRSGTQDAGVYLVSPATAAQAALQGGFSSPEHWGQPLQKFELPEQAPSIRGHFLYPPQDGSAVQVEMGPNIAPLQEFPALPERLQAPVWLKSGDNVSTDHILPGGAEITALRSNIPAISRHVFSRLDPEFQQRAQSSSQGVIVAGENYGQGSSREHAALAPRHLGVAAVLAKSLARIHRANLINFGILPLFFRDQEDYARLSQGDVLSLPCWELTPGGDVQIQVQDKELEILAGNDLSPEELQVIQAGGRLNLVRQRILGS